MAFRRRADGDPTLNAGLVALIFQEIWTSIAKEPYSFNLPPPPPTSGSANVYACITVSWRLIHKTHFTDI